MSNALLRELASRVTQRGYLVVDLFAGILSTTVTCCTMLCHRMIAGCEADPECFLVAKETVLRQFSKAVFGAGTDAELNDEAAKAAARVTSLVPEVITAKPLWSSPDGLPL